MSRTYRESRFGEARPLRDGTLQYHSSGCRHHGDCGYCEANRTFSNRRRAPLDDLRTSHQ